MMLHLLQLELDQCISMPIYIGRYRQWKK